MISNYVFVLDGEWSDDDCDCDFVTSVHATLAGAERALDRWLVCNGIDPALARFAEYRDDLQVVNDLTLTMSEDLEISYGIHKHSVEV